MIEENDYNLITHSQKCELLGYLGGWLNLSANYRYSDVTAEISPDHVPSYVDAV